MAIKIRKRIQRGDTTTADRKGPVAAMISGTSAALDYASNITSPLVFRPHFTISGLETKRPTMVSTRRHSKRARKATRPTELEMIAFASPAERPEEKLASDFGFELLSTSLVPQKFPQQELRSESPHARRDR